MSLIMGRVFCLLNKFFNIKQSVFSSSLQNKFKALESLLNLQRKNTYLNFLSGLLDLAIYL